MSYSPKIYLVLTDDWELRGDGSGDIETLQFENMEKLVRLYEKHGLKGSFFAELMQQLTFRKFQEDHKELKHLADRWDEILKDAFRKGHDAQLHIHPQWQGAKYQRQTWSLQSDWSLKNHPREQALKMIREGKAYLENLLKPLDPKYSCVAFRAGGWCLTPSSFLLPLLADEGIMLDASMVGGHHYKSEAYELDYRHCEETFLPFYPDMEDARKVSSNTEPIICVPTFHFFEPAYFVIKRKLIGVIKKLKQNNKAGAARKISGEDSPQTQDMGLNTRSYLTREFLWDLFKAPWKGFYRISDLSLLDYQTLRLMLKKIRAQAKASGLPEVPVIIENHTKLIKDFSSIEKFFSDISEAKDIQTHTLTELTFDLTHGRFSIRTR